MFESLTDKFDGILSKLRNKGRITEADLDEIMSEIRRALLEADVDFDVVKTLTGRIRDRCLGADLAKSLSPAQQVIKVVNEELTGILGGESLKIQYASRPPTVILLAGLQGAGKTTTAGKLAQWFKRQGRQPLLVGADLQRPAAVEQLRVLGSQVGVTVFSESSDPVGVAKAGLAEAQRLGRDVLIVDTAGRLAIDQELMEEVRDISAGVSPDYTFLVIDAMTGQDAVQTARAFHETLELDGVILTKLDGDARGGAALSVKEVVGKPIAFASTGEKLSDFDTFHPDRMANRILGMGDVLTLIEKAEREFDQQVVEDTASRLMEGRFTLDDFLSQMQQVKRMGPLKGVLSMLPGIPKEIKNADLDDGQLTKVEAVIRSMTPAERENPRMVDNQRRNRIAAGSGTSSADVSQLLRQFSEMQKMMRTLGLGGAMRARPAGPKRNGKKQKQGSRVTEKGTGVLTKSAGAQMTKELEGLAGPGLGGVGGGLFGSKAGFPDLQGLKDIVGGAGIGDILGGETPSPTRATPAPRKQGKPKRKKR